MMPPSRFGSPVGKGGYGLGLAIGWHAGGLGGRAAGCRRRRVGRAVAAGGGSPDGRSDGFPPPAESRRTARGLRSAATRGRWGKHAQRRPLPKPPGNGPTLPGPRANALAGCRRDQRPKAAFTAALTDELTRPVTKDAALLAADVRMSPASGQPVLCKRQALLPMKYNHFRIAAKRIINLHRVGRSCPGS